MLVYIRSVLILLHRRLSGFRAPLIVWGVGIGVAVSLFMSSVPLFKKDILQKVPVVGCSLP